MWFHTTELFLEKEKFSFPLAEQKIEEVRL